MEIRAAGGEGSELDDAALGDLAPTASNRRCWWTSGGPWPRRPMVFEPPLQACPPHPGVTEDGELEGLLQQPRAAFGEAHLETHPLVLDLAEVHASRGGAASLTRPASAASTKPGTLDE